MFIFYRNSILASAISLFSCALAVMGVKSYLDGELPIEHAALAVVIGVIGIALGKLVSNRKTFKKWVKALEEKGIHERIRASVSDACAVYKQNPGKRTLQYIETLNPTAAAVIRGTAPAPAPRPRPETRAPQSKPEPIAPQPKPAQPANAQPPEQPAQRQAYAQPAPVTPAAPVVKPEPVEKTAPAAPAAPAAPNEWTCSKCGKVGNRSRFCEDCGSKRPEEPKRYQCQSCGWIPPNPYKPPKFCPDCGDPIDENDVWRG